MMVAQVEPNPSSSASSRSLELLRGWVGRDGLSCNHHHHSSVVPRCAGPDLSLGELLSACGGGCSSVLYHQDDRGSDTTSTLSSSSVDGPHFTFTPPPRIEAVSFEFRPALTHRSPPPLHTKRVRHRLDVDGPNTAALCCKKRRLRAQLITSRLSQPYSLPATHILNREGLKSGDKRFLKMAMSLDVARRIAHLHATSFLRFSVMNRLRRRLGLGRSSQRCDEGKAEEGQLDTSSKVPWKPQVLEGSSGGKYLQPTRDASPTAPGHPPKAQACWISKPAALPLPPSDLVAAKRRTSSRIHPIRSPEMRPDRGAYDELDEDSFSFQHLDDDPVGDSGGGDDSSENVYSDFGVIFSGGASDDDQSYEEYLDELDGISWVTM